MFNGRLPMTIDAPVTFNPPKNLDGTTRTIDRNSTPITFNTDITNNGGVTNNGDVIHNGNVTIDSGKTTVNDNGEEKTLDDYVNDHVGGGGGNGVLFGYVESGDGSEYQVDVSLSSNALTTITVTFPNLTSNDKIEAGEFIMPIAAVVSGDSTTYYANPPAPLVYYGVVTGGSGVNPICQIYTLAGTLAATTSVTVLDMDSGASLPVGSYLFPVVRSGGGFKCQPPVWL